MCRVPFDIPIYRIRIIIDKVDEQTTNVISYTTSNIHAIRDEFGLDFRVLDSHDDAALNILFELEEYENVDEIFRSLGIPTY
jgi:hypothetical protein